ncbi:MAG: helix-turn-helix transcriptional regulator [Bacteroidia bacterium]
MASKYFDKALAGIKPENRLFMQKNLDITEQVFAILKEKKLTQRDLAQLLGKSEPEVSRMLSGFQNLTLKTIVRLEMVLGQEIVTTPLRAKEKWENEKEIPALQITFFSSTAFTPIDIYKQPTSETPGMAAYSREATSPKPIPVKVTFDRKVQALS